MADDYTVSLREAVTLLGKKPATIRSYVRSGRLSRQYVDGFNGQEMRLSKSEVDTIKGELADSTQQGGDRVSDTPKKQSPSHTTEQSSGDGGNVARAIELLERELAELRKEKETLRQEGKDLTDKNFHMAGQLGYFQNQVETLKDQVKQLSAPAEAHTAKKTKEPSFWERLVLGRK